MYRINEYITEDGKHYTVSRRRFLFFWSEPDWLPIDHIAIVPNVFLSIDDAVAFIDNGLLCLRDYWPL